MEEVEAPVVQRLALLRAHKPFGMLLRALELVATAVRYAVLPHLHPERMRLRRERLVVVRRADAVLEAVVVVRPVDAAALKGEEPHRIAAERGDVGEALRRARETAPVPAPAANRAAGVERVEDHVLQPGRTVRRRHLPDAAEPSVKPAQRVLARAFAEDDPGVADFLRFPLANVSARPEGVLRRHAAFRVQAEAVHGVVGIRHERVHRPCHRHTPAVVGKAEVGIPPGMVHRPVLEITGRYIEAGHLAGHGEAPLLPAVETQSLRAERPDLPRRGIQPLQFVPHPHGVVIGVQLHVHVDAPRTVEHAPPVLSVPDRDGRLETLRRLHLRDPVRVLLYLVVQHARRTRQHDLAVPRDGHGPSRLERDGKIPVRERLVCGRADGTHARGNRRRNHYRLFHFFAPRRKYTKSGVGEQRRIAARGAIWYTGAMEKTALRAAVAAQIREKEGK